MDRAAHIHLCGHLRLTMSGAAQELALRGRQGRLLFAFLVLHRGRPVPRDALYLTAVCRGLAAVEHGAAKP